MNVLITGGAGYIGSHVVDYFCNLGLNVVVFDNLSSGFEENINNNAIFIKGDILNIESLDSLFRNNHFDFVIHLAALKSANESIYHIIDILIKI